MQFLAPYQFCDHSGSYTNIISVKLYYIYIYLIINSNQNGLARLLEVVSKMFVLRWYRYVHGLIINVRESITRTRRVKFRIR